MIVCLNGKLLPENKAHISIDDRGFLLGDGLYETLRVYGGRPFLLDEHLRRLKSGLTFVGINVSVPKIRAGILNVVRANKCKNAAVRVTVSRGVGAPGLDPSNAKQPTILITARPFTGYPKASRERGVTAAVVSVRRNDPEAVPPSLKSISLLNNVLAKREANKLKADEAIFLTAEGHVAEGATSNVFAIKEGRLFTPALDGHQLAGVTRAFVCRLGRREGLSVIETKMTVNDLFSSDELFLTNALMEVLPVTKLVQRGRSNRTWKKVGPVTAKLMICYTPGRQKSSATKPAFANPSKREL